MQSKNKRKKSVRKRLGDVFFALVCCVSLGAFLYCGSQLAGKLLEYNQSDTTYEEMAQLGVTSYQERIDADIDSADEQDVIPDSVSDDTLHIDWDAYKGTEIVGWFQMDKMNYPLMQHADNSYYLNHLPNGKYNAGGSIFLQNHNSPFLTDQNSFVYGHNMYNGSMFGSLKRYAKSSYKDHRFSIYLPDGTRHVYQFFSVATVQSGSKAYTWSFQSEDTFMEWQQHMLNQSLIGTSLESSKDAKYVTLSTCNGSHGTSKRLLVCGQEVEVIKLQEPASWYQEYATKYENGALEQQVFVDKVMTGLWSEQQATQ